MSTRKNSTDAHSFKAARCVLKGHPGIDAGYLLGSAATDRPRPDSDGDGFALVKSQGGMQWLTRASLLIGSMCGLFLFAAGAVAQGPESSTDAALPTPPKGLRILYGGDSWHRFMPTYAGLTAKAAGIKGQTIHWGDPVRKDIAELYSKGEIDVHSWGRPGWSSDKLHQILDPKPIEDGLKGNPDYRVYVQMAWAVHDGLGNRVAAREDYDNSKVEEGQAILDRERVKVEAAADKLNEKYGRQFFFLVPLGDATTKLRGMIVEGTFPGVTKQSDIFADSMPHAGPITAELAAYCNYAAIYRQSPVGLRIENGVPDEQRVILQTLAWETVSKYRYAGVKQEGTDSKK
ncbi:MAG: hypothetical protein ACKOT0_00650 [bacterium]